MQDQQIQAKRFFGLKVARTIFKILTVLGALSCIIALVDTIIAAFQRRPGLGTFSGQEFADLFLRTLLFYTAYQLIDVALSINDNLRKLIQPQPEPKADDGDPGRLSNDNKKVVKILEQHHRRLNTLEKERNS